VGSHTPRPTEICVFKLNYILTSQTAGAKKGYSLALVWANNRAQIRHSPWQLIIELIYHFKAGIVNSFLLAKETARMAMGSFDRSGKPLLCWSLLDNRL
jgi:hypothetical protein